MNKFTQESLRQRYIFYLADSGVKQGFISAQTSIPQSVLSQFKYAKQELNSDSEIVLDKFLKGKSY